MIGDPRLTKEQVRKSRMFFWVVWILAIGIPTLVFTTVWSLNEKLWWGSPVSTVIVTLVGYLVFWLWLNRRQRQSDNTIVLCYCGHSTGDHGSTQDMDRACYYGEDVPPNSRLCLCSNYTPRFWTMSERT